ncbi:MAG: phosphatidylglycerophosphatase A [Alphaproteobacteria bacterium]|nr:phosphatidylglycerophosphatase A [Alphaproteobacteria bacterium]
MSSIKFKIAYFLATWLYSGKAPKAPGTFGSLAALPFGYLILKYFGINGLLVAIPLIYFIGVWAANIVMKVKNIQDPGYIVIDEVVGQWIVLLVTPMNYYSFLIAFALFRLFDITKPYPACWADKKLHSATGVMLDDVFAGIYGLLVMELLKRFVF